MKEFERPRERLKEYGSFSLSNDELLAILLNKGTKNKSAKDLGLEVLNSVNKISDLKDITIEKLTNIKGIGQAGAITILSAIELRKRIFNNKNYNKKIVLKTADEIYQYIKYELFDKKQEYFYCLYVNSKKELIERKLLFMGTVNRSTHVINDRRTNRLRLLTPIECERLNQFPDNWTNTMIDTRRYFMMGNALVTGIIKKLGNSIESYIEKED